MILRLEKMGCNFWSDEPAKSDIGNYRVRTQDYEIQGKDGRLYFIEFTLWRNRKQARYNHKITGKPLKHIAYDIINNQGVAINLQYQDNNGTWGNIRLENKLSKSNYSYTQRDILRIVNRISVNKYDSVEFTGDRL